MWFFTFAAQQLRARWQSLLTVIVGVLLAAVIGANASLYTEAIAGVGLLQHLSRFDAAETHLYTRQSFAPIDSEDFAASRAAYDERVAAAQAMAFAGTSWQPRRYAGAETQSMFVLRGGAELSDVRLRVAAYDGLADFVEVVAGELPAASEGEGVPVALSARAAEALGLSVGDVLEIDQRGWDSSQIFTVEIVGLLRERDPDAGYWLAPSPLRIEATTSAALETNLLVSREAFERVATQFIPQPTVQVNWRALFPHERFVVSRLGAVSEQVALYDAEIAETLDEIVSDDGAPVVVTALPAVLSSYGSSVDLLNIPTGLILLQLGALVLFFLVVIAALVRRGERREIALLQSRGATDGQILLLRGIEAFLICVAAALVAPFVARLILAALLPLFTGISGVPLELDATVFAYAFGAGMVALVVLVWTVRPVLQQPLILAGGSAARSASQTWWQRYYVDVLLFIVGAIALSQLSQDRILTTAADGTVRADPLLLLTPALLFVAFSSILLRFIPMLMAALARVAARDSGLLGVLATWQVSREPLHYGRIIFLLALAIGIGGFAVTYQATLRGNEEDQALYQVGADQRVTLNADATPAQVQALSQALAEQPDVTALSANNRLTLASLSTGTVGASGGRPRSRETGVLLAIDPATIAEVAYNRADLGGVAPPRYDGEIPQAGRALPEGTEQVRVLLRADAQARLDFSVYTDAFVNQPSLLPGVFRIELRLRDDLDTLYRLPLVADEAALEALFGNPDERVNQPPPEPQEFVPPTEEELLAREFPNDGWVPFTASLEDLPDGLRVDGLLLTTDVGFSSPYRQARLSFADWQALDTAGQATPLEWGDPAEWSFVNQFFTVSEQPSAALVTPPQSVGSAVALTFSHDNDRAVFGLLLNHPELISVSNSRSHAVALEEDEIVGLPVAVSRSLAERNDLEIGQRFSLLVEGVTLWFEIASISDAYPTLYQETPYLIAEQDILRYTLLRHLNENTLPADLWLRLAPNAEAEGVQAVLSDDEFAALVDEFASAQAVLSGFRTDTLSLGIVGLLYLSFVIGMVLSAVSLFTYVSLSIQDRFGEFAVLQALGFSRRKLLLLIVLEQTLVLLTALALGAAIGYFLSVQVLPPLTISAAGGIVTPPYIIRFDLGALLLYGLLISAVMALVMLVSATRLRRISSAEALRFEGA